MRATASIGTAPSKKYVPIPRNPAVPMRAAARQPVAATVEDGDELDVSEEELQ